MITCLQFLLHVISSTLLRLIFKFLRITVGEVFFISFGHVEREEGEGGGGGWGHCFVAYFFTCLTRSS